VIYVFCAIAAAVGLAGAVALRKQSFFWCGGLLIGGLAAAAYAGAMGGSGLAFKLYYALGASMLPGWIGIGSLQAVFSRRWVRWPAIFVIMLSAVQFGLTLPATMNAEALVRLGGGNGAGVLVPGGWVLPTVLFNTFGLGFAAVAAFFAWWRAFRVQGAANAAAAVGLSLVVLGILCRSDAVYRIMVDGGLGSAFLLADAVAFGLIWAGARVTRELPSPLGRLLSVQSMGVPSP
jgi:hypothetical protein